MGKEGSASPLHSLVILDHSSLGPGARIGISVLAGLLALVLYPHSISFPIGSITISLPWAQIFPILVGMAFGPGYAMLAAIAGGAWFPLVLWANNGWANLLTVAAFLAKAALVAWLYRGKVSRKLFGPWRLVIAYFGLVAIQAGHIALFNPLMRLNVSFPPFWTSVPLLEGLPPALALSLIMKDAVGWFIYLTMLGVMIRLPLVLRILGCPTKPCSRHNHAIALGSLGGGALVWVILEVLGILLVPDLDHRNHASLTFLVLVTGTLLAARVLIHIQENQNRTAQRLSRSQEELSLALEAKTLLLQELYHRTKNNMQTIISALALRSGGPGPHDWPAIVGDTTSLIQTMALVHTHVYTKQRLSHLEAHILVPELADLVRASHPEPGGLVHFTFDLAPLALGLDMVMPFSLTIHELLTEAFRHPRGPDLELAISLGLRQDNQGSMVFTYRDNGPERPRGRETRPGYDAMGTTILRALVEIQLQGSIHWESHPGSHTCTIRLPPPAPMYQEPATTPS